MTTTKALMMIISASGLYLLILALAWPMLICLRWALSSVIKFRGVLRSAGWTTALDLTITLFLFLGAAAIAIFFAGLALDALAGRDPLTARAAATAFALLLTAIGIGIVYGKNPADSRWPHPLRIPAALVQQCSQAGRLTMAYRFWWFSIAQIALFGLGLLVGLSVLESYSLVPDDETGRRALATIAAYLVAMILGPSVAWLILRWASLHTTILMTVGDIEHESEDPADACWPSRRSKALRGNIYSLSRSLERLARRIERAEEGNPVAKIYFATAEKSRRFLRSEESLGNPIPPELRRLYVGVGATIAGCGAGLYDELATMSGARDREIQEFPASRASRPGGRFAVVLASIGQGADPADKIISILVKVTGVVLILIAVFLGQASLTDLLEQFK